ncbi:MAG TPA: hypothetical protein VHC49_03190 [Mycobacteriales bacterium]|nr:hypothetical protein [Mycobacteriales bacterium]
MRNRTNRLNRILLAVVGLIVLLAGTGGLLLGLGVFGEKRSQQSVVYPRAEKLLIDDQHWVWWVIGGVALLLALLALYWLIVQLRIERTGSVPVGRTRVGDSILPSSVLTAAIAEEAEGVPGVRRARARVVGAGGEPELALTVWLREGADVAEVRQAMDTDVVPHARQALGHERVQTWLRLEVDAGKRERVR